MKGKKKIPKFNVMNVGFFKSIKSRWRKPRGVDNKKRIRKKFAGALPRIGYRTPENLRGNHPAGKPEILVRNMNELDGVKGKLVRIAAALGMKKKLAIAERAKKLGLEIINAPKAKVPENNPKPVKQ